MKAVNEFRQDKASFEMWFSLYATVSFLAVCILFGIYIYCSFNSVGISASQTQEGELNKQGVAGASVTIN